MKRIVFLLMSFAIGLGLNAQSDGSYNYPYLTLQTESGDRQSLSVASLILNFENGSLLATNNGEVSGTFDVASLLKMFFDTSQALTLSYDDSDATTKNTTLIADNDQQMASVTLNGYTLYKDGYWNSVCFPFDVDLSDESSPLYGATACVLSSANLSGTTLYLTFTPTSLLEAGTPYIVKWDETADNLNSPTFSDVTVKSDQNSIDVSAVSFVGNYSTMSVTDDEASNLLYLATLNQLKTPQAGSTLTPFHAHFVLPTETQASLFSINVNGESSDIHATEINLRSTNESYYRLDGIQVDGYPVRGGLYIVSGRKIFLQ